MHSLLLATLCGPFPCISTSGLVNTELKERNSSKSVPSSEKKNHFLLDQFPEELHSLCDAMSASKHAGTHRGQDEAELSFPEASTPVWT